MGKQIKRRSRCALDPDYRTKAWRSSRYAPKNSSTSVSTIALRWAILLVVPLYFVPLFEPAHTQTLWSLEGIIAGHIVGFMLWVTIASRLLNHERQVLKTAIESEGATHIPQTLSQTSQNISPREFEQDVAWIFNTLTPYDAIVSGASGDGGIDVKLMQYNLLYGVVQCKYYAPDKTVAPQYVRELAAVKQRHKAQVAYLVTTARFSDATKREATHYGVKLIDGQKYTQLRQRAFAARSNGL